MVHLRVGTLGGHWSGLIWHKVERTGTGTSFLDSGFLEMLGNQSIGWGEAFGDRFSVELILSISRCIGTEVI